jgi:flavin-dependent dehydrogenase
MVYDVAIVGGGLGGLTLSIQLRKLGYSVILFEKEVFPFNKMCGEYISMESYDYLQRLGLNLDALNLPKITQLQISSPSGKKIHSSLDLGGFGIRRYTLDFLLSKIAIANGVSLQQGERVLEMDEVDDVFVLRSANNNYSARITIGAYGKRSNLDRKFGRLPLVRRSTKNYVAVKYHVYVDHPSNVIGLHTFQGGYCGISKVDDDIYCLCYLIDADFLKASNNDIKQMERDYLRKNPVLEIYFSSAKFINTEPITISQLTFQKKSTSKNNFLFVGDAAGSIVPCFGNGMSMAMHAANDLSGLLDKYFRTELSLQDVIEQYNSIWDESNKSRIQLGEVLQQQFAHKNRSELLIRFLSLFPFLMHLVIKKSHGKPF